MTTTDLTQRIRTLALEYDMLPRGKTVLCALSGGADSMALLHCLAQLRESLGFSLTAAHFNHKLRGAEAERDADFVRDYCQSAGISLEMGEGDVKAEAERQGLGIEDCARQMRYAFLEDAARRTNAARIATAHHADDNLETLLLHLTRGTGLRGLTGIPPVRGQIVRPMLNVSRAEIEAYVQEHSIPFVEDSTNADTEYLRNLLRAEVIPKLREGNPNLTEASVRTIQSLRADQNYLMARATELFHTANKAEEGLVIPTRTVAYSPRALSVRLIQLLLEGIEAPPPEYSHIEAVLHIAASDDPSGAVHLPGGVLVQRVYGDLLFAWRYDQEPLPPMEPISVQIGGVTSPPDVPWRLHCRETICPEAAEDDTFYISAAAISGPLTLRARATGDELALPNRRRKSLKKLMIEAKLPRRIREQTPVLADEAGVIAVAGFGPERSRLAKPGEAALALRFEQIETTQGDDARGARH